MTRLLGVSDSGVLVGEAATVVQAAVAPLLSSEFSYPQVYAAAPNGQDDTDVIADAAAKGLALRPGVYRATRPIDVANAVLVGVPRKTVIQVEGEALLSTSRAWESLHASGINFVAVGSGVRNFLRCTFTGIDVSSKKVIKDCEFRGHTRAAVSCAQYDNPYVIVDRCQFVGANMTTSSGVALAGNMDGSRIRDCDFLIGKHGVIVGQAGITMEITGCDFVHFGPGTDRTNVWAIPHDNYVNAGHGFQITDNKFGNENLDASDYRVVFADRGAPFDSRASVPGDWDMSTAVSDGYAIQGQITGNRFCGGPDGLRSPVVSHTPNLWAYTVRDNPAVGTPGEYAVEFAPGALPTRQTNTRVQAGSIIPGNTAQADTNAASEYMILS